MDKNNTRAPEYHSPLVLLLILRAVVPAYSIHTIISKYIDTQKHGV